MTEALRGLLVAGPDGAGFALAAGARLPLAVVSAMLGAFVGLFLHRCIVRIPEEVPVFAPGPVAVAGDARHAWIAVFRMMAVVWLSMALFALVACLLPVDGSPPPLGMRALALPAAADGEPVLRALWQVPVWWLFVSGVLIGAFVDLEHMIVPDRISIGGTLAGLLLSALVPEMQQAAGWKEGLALSAIGAAAGAVPLWLGDALGSRWLRRRGRIGPDGHAMGLGDVKLAAALGAFLGWRGAVFCIFGGVWLGAIVAIPLLALGRRRVLDKIPFGPYLASAALIWLFWGSRLVTLLL